ncbi:uncharacterized protein VICG_01842 [Vittaforma corneae ATCC 50505]|uniref:Uncharacterized protein n=1 Tax=Vittaforma corneae (strain ATCC 50505) TaxID=993615 RepID=L2GJU8_VITCO|nr:uncharacterized protein VICG_01842 [Vittaforma corneae ATCC 50505]ELA41143.1 hypothetical protein VICG_01842 [Vittaforma corneae ATCC 50505]
MRKFKNVDRIWILKKYPTAELITHASFYIFRLTVFIIIRALNFNIKAVNKRTITGANNIIISIIFSLFLVFFALYNIFTENIYGYYLATILMFHNFLLTIAMAILAHINVGTKTRYWYITLVIALSYILEMCISTVFIHKKRAESNKALFQRIGADQTINDIYSLRKRIETLSSINLFLPAVIILKIYFTPIIFVQRFENITFAILILTALQHVFTYANFYDEDLLQRRIAIAITIIKAVVIIVLIVLTSLNYANLIANGRDIRIILYADILLVTLMFLYCLCVDMKSFGKGLKKHILFRTRKLTLG